MSFEKLREVEAAMAHAVLRSFCDTLPPARRSERLREKLQPLVEEDTKNAVQAKRAEALTKRRRSRGRRRGRSAVAVAAARKDDEKEQEESEPEERGLAANLIAVTEAERQAMFDAFDLTDKDGNRGEWTEVTKIILDEVSETLAEAEANLESQDRWWRDCQNPVRRVILSGVAERRMTRRELTQTETIWRDVLGYQATNGWSDCQKVATIAGRMLLREWTQTGMYQSLLSAEELHECFEFPERLIGGLYRPGKANRNVWGRKLKPLFERQRNVVMAAMRYAQNVRNVLLQLGTKNFEFVDEFSESRANQLVMQFFPWADARQLGLADNIQDWGTFRDDLSLFGDLYHLFWTQEGWIMNEFTGLPHKIKPAECTWDLLTELFSRYPSKKKLTKQAIYWQQLREEKEQELKQARLLSVRKRAEAEALDRVQADAAAETRAEEGGNGGAVLDGRNDDDEGSSTGTGSGSGSGSEDSDCSDSDDQGDGGGSGGDGDGEGCEDPRAQVAAQEQHRKTRSMGPVQESQVKLIRQGGASLPLPRSRSTRRTFQGVAEEAEVAGVAGSKRKSRSAGLCENSAKDKKLRRPNPPSKKQLKEKRKSKSKKKPPSNSNDGNEKVHSKADDQPQVLPQEGHENGPDSSAQDESPAAEAEAGTGTADSSQSKGKGKRRSKEDIVKLEVRIIDAVDDDACSALSLVLPKEGEQFVNLKSYPSVPALLSLKENQEKVALVATLCKSKSGTVYSPKQVTTAPHLVSSAKEASKIQMAAAAAGLQSVRYNGDMSAIHPDLTYAVPGTKEYRKLGLDKTVLESVGAQVLGDLLHGVRVMGLLAPINPEKASEWLGASRESITTGFGWGGHSWHHGSRAPEGEFAEVREVNLEYMKEYFPDGGDCLGVLLEALGKAQEAILQHLDCQDEERTNEGRNTKYAGKFGERVGRPGTKAGEALFISIVCPDSKVMGEVIDRLKNKIKSRNSATGAQVHLHVDPQNPVPGSGYERVLMATWTVYFVCEGVSCPVQVTAILCNRSSICNRIANNKGVQELRANYNKGKAKFHEVHPNVHYEDNGPGLFAASRPLVMSYLPEEWNDGKKSQGSWVVHDQTEREGEYIQVQAKDGKRRLLTVGDQRLHKDKDLTAMGTSEVREITAPGSGILFAEVESIKAYYNKMAQHCATRYAAELVCHKWNLGEEHAWNLFYCHLQHYISPAQFIVKCLSLVHQWETLWSRNEEFKKTWLTACRTNGHDGKLASAFMHMTDHDKSGNLSNFLKRVTLSHYKKGIAYDPLFCKQQIELLHQFGNAFKDKNRKNSTISILKAAENETLGKIINAGKFVWPQAGTGLFLWGLLPEAPPWRAAECPIMDDSKKHFVKSVKNRSGDDRSPEEVEADDAQSRLLGKVAGDNKMMKNLESVHRGLLIVAYEDGTSHQAAENGGCEGVRPTKKRDILVKGMKELNFLPADGSGPYNPDFEVYWKDPEDKKWKEVSRDKLPKMLRVWKVSTVTAVRPDAD